MDQKTNVEELDSTIESLTKDSAEEVEETEETEEGIRKLLSYSLNKETKIYSGVVTTYKRKSENTKSYEFRRQFGNVSNLTIEEAKNYKKKLVLGIDSGSIKEYLQIDSKFIIAWEPAEALWKKFRFNLSEDINLKLGNDVVVKKGKKDYGILKKGTEIEVKKASPRLSIHLDGDECIYNLKKYGFAQVEYTKYKFEINLVDESNSTYESFKRDNPNDSISIEVKDIEGYKDVNQYKYNCVFEDKYLYFYMNNVNKLHKDKLTESELIELFNLYSDNSSHESKDEKVDESLISKRNRILSGAPGTGKSNELIEDSKKMNFKEVKRVTFYPTYRYGQFIGSYKPSPIYSESSETLYEADRNTKIEPCRKPIIDYKLIPGPFLDILCKSLKDPNNKYLLLIEEINRGDAASIFGDTFQLLDRDDKGTSKYGITFNEDIMNYLKTKNITDSEIKIPDNMYIWCTMNSADDGVKKLDSAFKRRWSFEYMHLNGRKDDKTQRHINSLILKTKFKCLTEKGLSGEIYWNKLREKINEILQDDKFNVPEDKLIGPFFLYEDEMSNEYTLINKLVMYLREDVLRYKSSELFGKNSFYNIHDLYEAGENIFSADKISDEDIESMAVRVESSKETKTEEGKVTESNNANIIDESQSQITESEINDSIETYLNSGDIDNE